MKTHVYFLNLRGLIEELKVPRPRSKENFMYLIFGFAADTLAKVLSPNTSKPVEPNLGTYAITAAIGTIVFFISYFLLKALYVDNGGDEAPYFLDRLLTLAWVTGCRAAVILLPLFLISRAMITFYPAPDPTLALGMAAILGCGLLGSGIYMFAVSSRSLREIRDAGTQFNAIALT